MIDTEFLRQLFPRTEEIPLEHRPPAAIHQRRVLINGELRSWQGSCQTVVSPVRFRNTAEVLEQVELGSYPEGSESDADDALAAALLAYDNGRGAWPTMSVAERIDCMHAFTKQMVACKRDVVRLIMWEIGKSLTDSEKEFDRTVAYIQATIEALKELDNSNSRFVLAEGTIGQIRRTPLGVVLCIGPYNYPLNETFATLIPALIMGNTVLFKPPKLGVLLFNPTSRRFRQRFSERRHQYDLRTRCGCCATVAGLGKSQRAHPHRLEQGCRPPQETASENTPVARHPRIGCKERCHRAS